MANTNEEQSGKTENPIISISGMLVGICNIIMGIAGFIIIGLLKQKILVNLIIIGILLIGVIAGIVLGIILLSANTKSGKGLFTIIVSGIMFLCLVVDGLFVVQNLSAEYGVTGKEESRDYATTIPESDLNQADIQSDTVIWINAVYAIPTYADGRDYRFIGGTSPEQENIDNLSSMLESAWGVTDRVSALQCVDKLIRKGHQSKYQEYLQDLKRWGILDLEEEDARRELENGSFDEKTQNQYIIAYRIYREQPENGILAWDYCRAVQQLGYYYVMDYITLEECMDQSLEIAEKLQSSFHSWDDMANSYLLGYEFWSGQEASDWGSEAYFRKQEYEDIMEYDPYIFALDWDYELVDTWTGAVHRTSEEDVYHVVASAYADYVKRMGYEVDPEHWLLGEDNK